MLAIRPVAALLVLPQLASALLPVWNKRCTIKSLNSENTVKRVALLLRGHSYPELGRFSQEIGVRDDVQNEILENYRENIIDAICDREEADVDVFIATPSTKFVDDLIKVTTPKVASVHNLEEEWEGKYFSNQVRTYLHLLKNVFEPYRQQEQVKYEYIIAARFDTPLKATLPSYMERSKDFKPDGFNFPFRETWPDWERQNRGIDFWWNVDHRVGDMFHVWHPRHTPMWISLLEKIDASQIGPVHMHLAYTNMTHLMPDGERNLGFLVDGFYSSVSTEPGWNTACFNPLNRVMPRDIQTAGVPADVCLHMSDFSWDERRKTYWCAEENCGLNEHTPHPMKRTVTAPVQAHLPSVGTPPIKQEEQDARGSLPAAWNKAFEKAQMRAKNLRIVPRN